MFLSPLFTTDVNSSAYVVRHLFVLQELLFTYHIGTGIELESCQNGEFIGGMGHTEAGHVYVPLSPK